MTTAWVRSTPGLQPEMVPSTESNRNTLDPLLPLAETTKPLPAVLKTVPVGVPCGASGCVGLGGMVTTSGFPAGWAWPWPLYSVLSPVPSSDTQNGLPELAVRPHGFTRWGSVTCARPGMSDT